MIWTFLAQDMKFSTRVREAGSQVRQTSKATSKYYFGQFEGNSTMKFSDFIDVRVFFLMAQTTRNTDTPSSRYQFINRTYNAVKSKRQTSASVSEIYSRVF